MTRLYYASLVLVSSILSSTTAFVMPRTTPSNTRLAAAAAEDNILNSPAFLQRKFEVLQTDMAKAQDALLAAQERLEQGKAEWGPQIADLQTEVSLSARARERLISTIAHIDTTSRFFPFFL